jgi:hypothetical protein
MSGPANHTIYVSKNNNNYYYDDGNNNNTFKEY